MGDQLVPSNSDLPAPKPAKAKTQPQLKREQEAATFAKNLREALHSKDLARCLQTLEDLQEADFQLRLDVKPGK